MAANDQDLIISVAVDYYEKELSQKEIAAKYRISRVTVSSYLKRSRQEGIVDIRVNKKPSLAFSLQTELQSCLELEKVVVCTADPDETRTRIIVGRAASDLLKSRLHDNITIGISYGTTLYETVHQLIVHRHFHGVHVVQLLGAMGSRDATQDGFELARALSAKLDGTYRILQAPLVVQNEKLKRMLLHEPQIAEVMEFARSAEVAVLGVSSNRPEISGIVRAGFLSLEESARLYQEGGVGNVCGIHYDVNGGILRLSLNARTIAISPDDLRAIPLRIAVACGVRKADAILGAIRAGFVNALVTDTDAALTMISMMKAAAATASRRSDQGR
ncbi:MAG TPA: sugar-binding domain-containing protein [Candidatus Methylomirabilis sp.]|nr:sugar-binding domain-containing protein [Anaeromyxobacter sp.]HTP28959.1 sugar-binding domain-containing protein [Anaeromyxobacteraceae bacterium]HXJ81483.1 sugar-binding domain-containing protein [Candidatus Methylomirabilis sp.]